MTLVYGHAKDTHKTMRKMQELLSPDQTLAEVLFARLPKPRRTTQIKGKGEGIQMTGEWIKAFTGKEPMLQCTDDFWIEAIAGARDDLHASQDWLARCREMVLVAEKRVMEDGERYDRLQREHGMDVIRIKEAI